jgi:hypothetical protein
MTFFQKSLVDKTERILSLSEEYKSTGDRFVISEECKKLHLQKNRYIIEIIDQTLIFYRPDYLVNVSEYEELITQLKLINEGITFCIPQNPMSFDSTESG